MLFTAQDLLQQYASATPHDDSARLHRLKHPPAVATLVIALRKKRVKTALSTTNERSQTESRAETRLTFVSAAGLSEAVAQEGVSLGLRCNEKEFDGVC